MIADRWSGSIRRRAVSWLAVLLFLPVSVWAESGEKEGSPEGAFFAVSVADLDRMVDWYCEHLDFEVLSRGENDQRRGALLERPGALLELASFEGSVSRSELAEGRESHRIHGIFKIGFRVADIGAAFERYSGQDAVEIFFPLVAASDGSRTFALMDPEKNIVQFFGQE